MNLDLKNKKLIKQLDDISKNISQFVNLKDYFKLSDEQSLTVSYSVFYFLKTKINASNDNDLKSLIIFLRKKNELDENYELSSIFHNVSINFDNLNDVFNIKINKKEKNNVNEHR